MGSLETHWVQTQGEKGRTLLLQGEAGSGKTRLFQHFLEQFGTSPRYLFHFTGYETLSGVIYAPIAVGIEQFLRAKENRELKKTFKKAKALQQLFPILLGEASAGTSGHSELENVRLLHSLSQTFTELSQKQPIILFFDDLHWMDSATLRLFHYLAQGISDTRILLVGAFRTEEIQTSGPFSTFVNALQRCKNTFPIQVTALNHEECTRFFIQKVGGSPATELRGKLIEISKGNVLFLTSLLQSLIDNKQLHFDGKCWHLLVRELPVPQTVLELIQGKMHTLEPFQQQLLSTLSIADNGVSHELLCRLFQENSEIELLTQLKKLMKLGFLYEVIQEDELLYQWTHPLIRKGVYLELPLALRRRLHGHFANLLEANVKNIPYLANHYCGMAISNLKPEALEILYQAGIHAYHAGANTEAMRFLETSLKLTRHLGDQKRMPQLLEKLGEILGIQGNFWSAQNHLQEAMVLYQKDGQQLGIARSHRLLSHVKWKLLEFKSALQHLEEGLKLLDPLEEREEWERLQSERLTYLDRLYEFGKLDELHHSFRNSQAFKSSSHFQVAIGLSEIGFMLREGQHAEASTKVETLLTLAHQNNDWNQLLRVRNFAGLIAIAQGDHFTSERHVQANLQLVQQHELVAIEPSVLAVGMMSAYIKGDWELAHQRAKSGTFISQRIGLARYHTRMCATQAYLYAYQGAFQSSQKSCEEAREILGARTDDIPASASLWISEALLAVEQEQFQKAREILSQLPLHPSGFRIDGSVALLFLQCWGHIYAGLKQHGDLQRLIDALRTFDSTTEYAKGWGFYFEGELSKATQQSEKALYSYEQAAQRFEDLALPFDLARTYLRWLQVYLSKATSPIPQKVASKAQKTYQLFKELQANKYVSIVQALIDQISHPTPHIRSTMKGELQPQLSTRERDVLRGILDGLSNKEIAHVLQISHHTVSSHLKRIYKRLGVHSRLELHTYSLKHDLLSIEKTNSPKS